MPERLARPKIEEGQSPFLQLTEWSTFLKKVKEQEERGIGVRNRPLDGPDEGQVDGLVSNFHGALADRDATGVIASLARMVDLVEERRQQNEELAKVERPVGRQKQFENIVTGYLPDYPLTRDNKTGNKVISSYESGISQVFKKKIWELLSKAGTSKKRRYEKVSDDGVVISKDGITIYNPVTRGGDPREGEFITWENSAGLSFVPESPGILAPLNSLRRGFFARPQPIAPVGFLLIFERAGQDTDEEIPDKAQVILRNPQKWVDMLDELREKLGSKDGEGDSRKNFVRPITWHDYVQAGLLLKDGENSIRLLGILVNTASRQQVEEIEAWAKEPRIRRTRGRWF